MDFLANQLNRQLLEYAVGRTMLCPECEEVLDSDKAVLGTPREGKAGKAFVLCTSCFDRDIENLRGVDLAVYIARFETIDGRETTEK